MYGNSLVIVRYVLRIYALNDLNLNKNNIMKDKCFLFSWSWWLGVALGSTVGTLLGWLIADFIIWAFDLNHPSFFLSLLRLLPTSALFLSVGSSGFLML